MSSETFFSVPALIQEQLKLIQLNQARLAADMASPAASREDAGASERHVRMANELARSIKTLGEELRHWAGTENKAFDKMTPVRKLQAIVAFLETLPRSERIKAYKSLAKFELSLEVDAIQLQVTDG